MARQNMETTKILSPLTHTRVHSNRRRNRPAHSRKRKKDRRHPTNPQRNRNENWRVPKPKMDSAKRASQHPNAQHSRKNSLPRIFNISPKLVAILQSLPKINERIFGLTKPKYAQSNFSRSRKAIARKVGNPRLAKIHFHLIRHWFGTMEYHKKPDPDYVRRRLGHKKPAVNANIHQHGASAILKQLQ